MAILSDTRKSVEDLFENKFNQITFKKFISDLFQKNLSYSLKINCEEESWIKECEKLHSDKKIDTLIIKTKKPVEKSRLYHRDFVKQYLKSENKDYALVAFHCERENEWRLSFIEKMYKKSNGRIKERHTHYKRSSFLAGDKIGTHTVKFRMWKALQEISKNKKFKVKSLKDVFNIETVSDEFFNEYKELYGKVKNNINIQREEDKQLDEHLQSKHIKSDDLAKHLLGQIIFLYFIQKKGWFGVSKEETEWGNGDKDFLKEVFNKNERYGSYNNFFSDVLEPLFYEVLSKKRLNDICNKFNCRIPFLNGGLFEPYKKYKYKKFRLQFSNNLFSSDENTKFGDEGNGILDIFGRYNFTVKEDEPLEKEVAIDPEMLGRIFESLIPENERRKKGAYYTPREIVYYMCQESLIYCLLSEFKNKVKKEDIEKFIRHEYNSVTRDKLPNTVEENKKDIDCFLKKVTVCDPAVGSGAFPVAMMLEIIKLRELLNPENFNMYEAKLKCIENSLYGVDNDEGSVEVAKLRLWLSLVVDEENPKAIRPLPNLEYKIMHGNSLLDNLKQTSFVKNKMEYVLPTLRNSKLSFFKETEENKKKSYRDKIDALFKSITGKSFNNDNFLFRDFYFDVYFSEVMKERGGFDIVITNPPYLRQEELTKLNYKPKLESQGFEVYTSSMDIYGYFYERAFNLLNQKRISTFITSNKWLRATYGQKLRNFFEDKVTVNNIIDLQGNEIFSSATVDTNILTFQKQAVGAEYSIPYADSSNEKLNNVIPIHEQFDTSFYTPDMQGAPWLLLNKIEKVIKEKMEAKGIPLVDWDICFYRGILTGYNNAFIINTETKNKLCKEHPSSKKIIRPLLRGKDIGKWYYSWKNLWLINSHNGYGNIEPINVKRNYPAIWNYLRQMNIETNKKIEKRCDQGFHWSNLRSCDYFEEFEKEKIIYPNMTKSVNFVYDETGIYVNQKCYIITSSDTDNLKFIIGQLNSSLIYFFIKKTFPLLKGGTVELNKDKFKDLSLLPVDCFTGTNCRKYVNQIIDITSSKDYSTNNIKKQKVKNLQSKIDQIVFDLYGLSQKEQDYILKNVQQYT